MRVPLDDVVLIHTTRPSNVVSQLSSFLENIIQFQIKGCPPLPFFEEDLTGFKGVREVMFIYVCDVPGSGEYEEPLKDAHRLIHNCGLKDHVSLLFFDLAAQDKILSELARDVAQITGRSVERCKDVFRDWKGDKLGGRRGCQNKSIVLADYVTKQVRPPVIYHKLDDDIYAYIATFDGDMLMVTQGYNIFAHKAKKIAETKGILASRYCIDTPSPLADVNEALTDILKVLGALMQGGVKLDDCWSETARMLFTVPLHYVDQSGLVNFPLRRDMTYREALGVMGNLVEVLLNGNNRLCLNTLENLGRSYYGPRDCAPGGFMSFSSSLQIRPNIRGANQDLIFTDFEHALGNPVYGDWPVGHIKSLSNRDTILNTMSYDPSRVGTRTNDFGTTYAVLRTAVDEGIVISAGLNESASVFGWGLRLITVEHVKKNLALMKKRIAILMQNHDKDVLHLLFPLEKLATLMENSMEGVGALLDYHHQPSEVTDAAKELYGLWKEDKEIFYHFRMRAHNG